MNIQARPALLAFERSTAGRRVFVTGHTGFTGSWLCLWLHALGCEVSGLALAPDTEPNLFTAARIGEVLQSELGDIRDFALVQKAMRRAQPSLVFHLAAQPLVSRAFADPIETFATNALGTAHVLEAARQTPGVEAVVCVTTDKVYADARTAHREGDSLGGKDPYSASKAAAEMIAAAYQHTLARRGNKCRIATARGGNIIGGGDWSQDRIVPDFARAVSSSQPLVLRIPDAVRPWQHVLALTHGYLSLAHGLLQDDAAVSAWNFGPIESDAVPVRKVVERMADEWKRPKIEIAEGAFPESGYLSVDSAKARQGLHWRPALDFEGAIKFTAEWYRDYYAKPSSARELTVAQISSYRDSLRTRDGS